MIAVTFKKSIQWLEIKIKEIAPKNRTKRQSLTIEEIRKLKKQFRRCNI